MYFITSFLQMLAITLTFSTAIGVFLHDTKIDVATSSFSQSQAAAHTGVVDKSFSLGTDLHIHHEHQGFASLTREGSPLIQPRFLDKKYIIHKAFSKKHHFFDAWHIPLLVRI
jgi:hypothetical protein